MQELDIDLSLETIKNPDRFLCRSKISCGLVSNVRPDPIVLYCSKAYAVVVDCLNNDAKQFYLKYGFEVLCDYNGRTRLFISMKTVEQLFS